MNSSFLFTTKVTIFPTANSKGCFINESCYGYTNSLELRSKAN
jgi:hypothetical protein